MQYKNSVFRYHIPDHTWTRVFSRGDSLIPRYLAAAGATGTGDYVYIVGGYGSSSGQQILNPRNLYDMMRFDVRTKTFKKLFELSPIPEDFAFANSLIIDQKNRSYYGLIFNNAKYHSDLQLIKGSLDGPTYQAVGNKIPYLFHDIESFTDLYYSPAGDRFVAVVFFTDSTSPRPTRTYVHLYSLDGPPEPYLAETPVIGPAPHGGFHDYIWYLLLPLLLIAGGGLYMFGRSRRKSMVSPAGERHAAAGSVTAVTDPLPPASPLASGKREPVEPAIVRASIFLFGDLQVFDAEGEDLTKQFSPLLKQLFLLILLHSLKNNRGISSEKLNDILWFDKDEKSARNNRSVNIAKLKALLDKTGGCDLSKETGYWKIEVDPQAVRVDYLDYLSIIQNRETLYKKEVKALAAITQRGSLLNDVEYPWLDPFKSDVSNHVIDTYLHFATQGSSDPEFMIELADYIFYFDSVNEEAMMIKCRALVQLGKHSLAKNAYTTFLKEYKHIYGEDFRKDFRRVLQA
jgi:DNA-binding SARP family transcriptional activator